MLETGERCSGNSKDRVQIGRFRAIRHHQSQHCFTEIRMRHTNDGAFPNPGLGIQDQLDLLRVDVVATGNDQVLVAPDDMDIAVCVDHPEITGDEEAVLPQFGSGLLRHLPIPLEDVRAAHLDLANRFGRQRVARRGVRNLQFHARERETDRPGAAFAFIRVGGIHVGFGHAVSLQDPVTGPFLELPVRFGKQRRASGNEQPHALCEVRRKTLVLKQSGVEGRHTHHRRCLGHQIDHGVEIEFRQEQDGTTSSQRHVGCNEKPVSVEDRQGMQQHILVGEAPELRQGGGIRQQVRLRQHCPLRPPGGAGGVKESGQIVRRPFHCCKFGGFGFGLIRQRPASVSVERLEAGAEFRDDRVQQGLAATVADHGPGAAVFDKVAELIDGVGRIERQEHDPRLGTGRVKSQRRG